MREYGPMPVPAKIVAAGVLGLLIGYFQGEHGRMVHECWGRAAAISAASGTAFECTNSVRTGPRSKNCSVAATRANEALLRGNRFFTDSVLDSLGASWEAGLRFCCHDPVGEEGRVKAERLTVCIDSNSPEARAFDEMLRQRAVKPGP